MKYIFIFSFLLYGLLASAQKVYQVKYESQADIKIFPVKYEAQADIKIYFVEYESQTDLKIYYVDYESQAGWKNKEKMHLLKFRKK
jgi:hypothetical protein